MPLLETPRGPIEYLVTGSGRPVTVFAHGLAGSIADTRPFGGGVRGSRAFFHFQGHGSDGRGFHSPGVDSQAASETADRPWTYDRLAGELAAVADHVEATRALGVSMGAGALTALTAAQPSRFERLVFVLPSVLDRSRSRSSTGRFERLAVCAERGNIDAAARLLLDEQPPVLWERRDVRLWVRRQAEVLVAAAATGGLSQLAAAVPIADRRALAAAPAPALVIAQDDDAAHPVPVAEELAGALPQAELVVLPAGGVLWSHRRRVRELISGFLNDHD